MAAVVDQVELAVHASQQVDIPVIITAPPLSAVTVETLTSTLAIPLLPVVPEAPVAAVAA
jgi:hypothetical protein